MTKWISQTNSLFDRCQHVQVCGDADAKLEPFVKAAYQTWDIKKEVKEPATSGKTAFCICMGNKDLEPFFPFAMIAAQTISIAIDFVKKIGSLR